MIDIKQFETLKKSSAKSYNDQKALIKKVLSGRDIACSQCKSLIGLVISEDKLTTRLMCAKGCTDIMLELAP
jgi:hypothetical protein